MSDPILIWGAGAIGGTLGAAFIRAGEPVLFVDNAADHVAAINREGLKIEGPIETYAVAARACLPREVEGRFRRTFLAVKAHHTKIAIADLAPHLEPDGWVVSAQNGLNEMDIEEVVGAERTIGCFVNFGADYLSPGVIHYAGRGAVVVGELDGTMTPRLAQIHALMQRFEPNAIQTPNIWGFLWGKLGYGALLFATALTEASICDALAATAYHPLYRAIGNEAMAVAQARGVPPEGFNGFDPAAFMPGMPAAAAERSLADMVAFNAKSAKTHSGIYRDLAVRKRKTEVDAQLGPIVLLGRLAGIRTPVVERLIALIHEIEDGARPLAWSTLDELAAMVR